MSLCDCEKCWDNPCLCGYNYRHLKTKDILGLITALKNMISDRTTEGATQTDLAGEQCNDDRVVAEEKPDRQYRNCKDWG